MFIVFDQLSVHVHGRAVELADLHVEGEAALDIPSGEERSFRTAFGDLDIPSNAVRPVRYVGTGVDRYRLRAWIIKVPLDVLRGDGIPKNEEESRNSIVSVNGELPDIGNFMGAF